MGSNRYVGTQTEKNLLEAFSGESQARNKYTYFGSVAKKEGYEQMSALFLKTANNEKEHAKMWFKELAGIGDTKENLAAAAEGENYEWTDMYEGFAKTAEEVSKEVVKILDSKGGQSAYEGSSYSELLNKHNGVKQYEVNFYLTGGNDTDYPIYGTKQAGKDDIGFTLSSVKDQETTNKAKATEQ